MEPEDPYHDDALIVHYDTMLNILERWLKHGGIEPALAAAAPGEVEAISDSSESSRLSE